MIQVRRIPNKRDSKQTRNKQKDTVYNYSPKHPRVSHEFTASYKIILLFVMKIKQLTKRRITMYYVKEMVFISPCRKTLMRLCFYASIFGLSFLFFWIPHLLISRNFFLEYTHNRYPTDLKYILMWKSSHTIKVPFQKHTVPEGQTVFIKQECEYINCYITYNRDLLKYDNQNFDAVVFNIRDMVKYPPEDIFLQRSSGQNYIFHSLDSSGKYPVCNSFYDHFFNWTWTYKLNSDIPQTLINIYNKKKEWVGPKKNMSWIQKMDRRDRFNRKSFNKTKAVAWLIPRCKTKNKYQDFINELKNELKGYNYTLDLYGPCGNKKCPNGSIPKCLKMIEKRYFFQLVLEDSLSEDYVSERMVKALSYIVVPIILGISDYKSFLPPGSYINAQSFDMKKIGAIIDYLMKYPDTYYYFFDWRNHYYYTARPRSQMCDLCTKLNGNETGSSCTTYKDFRKWWNPDYRDVCQQLSVSNIMV